MAADPPNCVGRKGSPPPPPPPETRTRRPPRRACPPPPRGRRPINPTTASRRSTPDEQDWQPHERTAAGMNPVGASPPTDGLMTFEDAVIAAADMRRRVAADARARGHPTARPGKRALP